MDGKSGVRARAACQPSADCSGDRPRRMFGSAGGAPIPCEMEEGDLVEEPAADLVLSRFREELAGGVQAARVPEKGPRVLHRVERRLDPNIEIDLFVAGFPCAPFSSFRNPS